MKPRIAIQLLFCILNTFSLEYAFSAEDIEQETKEARAARTVFDELHIEEREASIFICRISSRYFNRNLRHPVSKAIFHPN